MTDNLPDVVEPYYGLSPKAYEHPADRAATAALKAIPLLDGLVKRLIEWRYERAVRQFFLGTSMQVSERQLPELWASHSAASRILDLDVTPDLYVTSPVRGSAITIGTKQPMIVIDSGFLRCLGPGEQRAVVGHELGHVLSEHVVYTTALNILLSAGNSLPFLFDLPFRGVQTVLLEWYRAAELTCDRAATLVVRDPMIVCRLLLVAASGMPASELNVDAFMAQAMDYENWDAPTDRVRRFFTEIGLTHPYAVRRVSEVMTWVQSGEYDRIIRGDYRKRDEPNDPRAEAGDAMDYYAERFRSVLGDMGSNITNFGEQVGGFAEQAAEWFRRGRGGSGPDDSSGGAGS